MDIELGYGKEKATANVPDKNVQAVLTPNEIRVELTGADEVKREMMIPIGIGRLKSIVKKGESVCIITSDITRPMPSKLVLPAVLEELYLGGIEDADITSGICAG